MQHWAEERLFRACIKGDDKPAKASRWNVRPLGCVFRDGWAQKTHPKGGIAVVRFRLFMDDSHEL